MTFLHKFTLFFGKKPKKHVPDLPFSGTYHPNQSGDFMGDWYIKLGDLSKFLGG